MFKWASGSGEILSTLVFSTPIVPRLWNSLVNTGALGIMAGDKKDVSDGSSLGEVCDLVSLFCTCYSHLLLILDDDEFFVKQHPFRLEEVGSVALVSA